MQIIDKDPTHPTPTIKKLIYRPYISDICCAKSKVSRHFQSLACWSTAHRITDVSGLLINYLRIDKMLV